MGISLAGVFKIEGMLDEEEVMFWERLISFTSRSFPRCYRTASTCLSSREQYFVVPRQ